jgi:hypothetical protein
MGSLQPVTELVLDGYDISRGFITDMFCVFDTDNLGIEAIVQGGTAPTGTFQVLSSCELYEPINFCQVIPEATQAITDNSLIVWNFAGAFAPAFNWVQVMYTPISGTGFCTLYITKKVGYKNA